MSIYKVYVVKFAIVSILNPSYKVNFLNKVTTKIIRGKKKEV